MKLSGGHRTMLQLRFLVLGSISNRFHYEKDLQPVSRPVTTLGPPQATITSHGSVNWSVFYQTVTTLGP